MYYKYMIFNLFDTIFWVNKYLFFYRNMLHFDVCHYIEALYRHSKIRIFDIEVI